MHRINLLSLTLLLYAYSGNTWSSPVQWLVADGGNDHWYEAIAVTDAYGISWQAASDAAALQYGELATATSAAENEFIFNLIDSQEFWVIDIAGNSEGPWLGGFYTGPLNAIPANPDSWNWVTGETWDFTHWATNEPTNYPDEFYINYFALGGAGTSFASTWNNIPNELPLGSETQIAGKNGEVHGYIIEWDGNPSAIPVPPAVWLFGTGLLGLIGVARKRRR